MNPKCTILGGALLLVACSTPPIQDTRRDLATDQRPESLSTLIKSFSPQPEDYCVEAQGAPSIGRNDSELETVYRVSRGTNDRVIGINLEQTVGKPLPTLFDEEILNEFDFSAPKIEWDFKFPGRSQEAYLGLAEWPLREHRDPKTKKLVDRYTSTDLSLKWLYFFPRKVIPSIDIDREVRPFGPSTTPNDRNPDRLRITLPTGEDFVFDRRSQKIVGGAMTQVPKKIDQTWIKGIRPSDRRAFEVRRIYPDLETKYQGSGVVVEARIGSKVSDTDPGQTVTIRRMKPKEEICRVPSEELFLTSRGTRILEDGAKAEWECVRVKFPNDQELESYLQSRCGFGLLPPIQ